MTISKCVSRLTPHRLFFFTTTLFFEKKDLMRRRQQATGDDLAPDYADFASKTESAAEASAAAVAKAEPAANIYGQTADEKQHNAETPAVPQATMTSMYGAVSLPPSDRQADREQQAPATSAAAAVDYSVMRGVDQANIAASQPEYVNNEVVTNNGRASAAPPGEAIYANDEAADKLEQPPAPATSASIYGEIVPQAPVSSNGEESNIYSNWENAAEKKDEAKAVQSSAVSGALSRVDGIIKCWVLPTPSRYSAFPSAS